MSKVTLFVLYLFAQGAGILFVGYFSDQKTPIGNITSTIGIVLSIMLAISSLLFNWSRATNEEDLAKGICRLAERMLHAALFYLVAIGIKLNQSSGNTYEFLKPMHYFFIWITLMLSQYRAIDVIYLILNILVDRHKIIKFSGHDHPDEIQLKTLKDLWKTK